MTEKNSVWLPIIRLNPDPVERLLRVLWSYEQHPVRIRKVCRLEIVGKR